jgi:hypothetical protein
MPTKDRRRFNPGRAGFRPSEKQVQKRLNEHNGLMRDKLKVLGLAALTNVLTKPRLTRKQLTQVTDALLTVRNRWLSFGYDDRRVLEGANEKAVSADGLMLASHRRGNLQAVLYNDDDNKLL